MRSSVLQKKDGCFVLREAFFVKKKREGMKAVVAAVLVLFGLCAVATAGRVVMPWMCLERCGENVQADLAQLVALGPAVVPWVSIEAYDLTTDAMIKDCGFSRVGPQLKQAGISVHPMITSANITKLRDLWKSPQTFVDMAVRIARENKAWLDGFNIDFEPPMTNPATHDDAVHFARFVELLAQALHREGVNLTVDIADWCPLFDDKLLAQTSVDRFVTMSTYQVNISRYETIVHNKVAIYGTAQAGIGLEVLPKYTAADIKKRLAIARNAGVDTIGVWMTPLPESWVPYFRDFVSAP